MHPIERELRRQSCQMAKILVLGYVAMKLHGMADWIMKRAA